AVALAADPARIRDASNVIAQAVRREQSRLRSLGRFLKVRYADRIDPLCAALAETGRSLLEAVVSHDEAARIARAGFMLASLDPRVPVRNADVKGPIDMGGAWLGISAPLAIA